MYYITINVMSECNGESVLWTTLAAHTTNLTSSLVYYLSQDIFMYSILMLLGVLNIVSCSRSNAAGIGQLFSSDPKVSTVSFTGSCEVGKVSLGGENSH